MGSQAVLTNFGDGNAIDRLREAVERTVEFRPDLPVPRSDSLFGDDVWDFYDPENPKHLVKSPHYLRLTWKEAPNTKKPGENMKSFDRELPERIREDMKRFAWLHVGSAIPNMYGGHTKRRPLRALSTSILHVRLVCSLLAWIARHAEEKGLTLYALSDITAEMIREGVATCPYHMSTTTYRALMLLADRTVRDNQAEPLDLTANEVRRFPWKRLLRENKDHRHKLGRTLASRGRDNADQDGQFPLDPRLYVWLSNTARAGVRDFLESIGHTPEDRAANPEYEGRRADMRLLSQREPDFVADWDAYDPGDDAAGKRMRKKGGGATPVRAEVENAKRAAMVLVLLYTGMRFSEAALIRVPEEGPTIVTENGFHFIVSTVVKGNSGSHGLDTDRWVAIDCVRDAVHVLEIISRKKSVPYLFSQSVRHRRGPLTRDPLAYQVYAFIAENDREERFVTSWWEVKEGVKGKHRCFSWKNGVPPHLARFRESLAFELARVGCGLHFLTLQLHHTYSVLCNVGSCTMGYGRQAEVRAARVRGAVPRLPGRERVNPGLLERVSERVVAAREEILSALFDDGRNLAGGGAEEHRESVHVFFTGRPAVGPEGRARLVKKLAKGDVPLTICGYGLCGKKRDAQDQAPCQGDLCPPDCPNHLVPDTAKPVLIRRWAHAVKQAARPEQTLNRAKWEWDKGWYETQLRSLGVDPATLDPNAIESVVQALVAEESARVYRRAADGQD